MNKILFFIGFVVFCSFLHSEEIVFPPHPRILYNQSEIEAWKKDPQKTKEIEKIIKQADSIISEPLYVPDKEGDWIFYYFCPKDNAMLKPVDNEKHICPVCKKVYCDERTIAAYRTVINNKLDKDAVTVASAFAFTGEGKYANRVKEYLLKLAQLYPLFQRHDRWGRKGIFAVVGGRRYAQNLDEAVSAISLANAYDLIANAKCLSFEEKQTIEELLKNIVREILKYEVFHGGKNNHQTWFNAAYAVVGVATGDSELIKESIYGKYGLLWQIENSVTSDGLWYEGTIAYHFYALEAIQYTLDAVKVIGWDFSKNEKLKSMWLGPINMAYPDGKFPVFHDSDPVELKNYQKFYLWAYKYFGDKLFARYAGIQIPDVKNVELKSTNLSGIGVAVLRKGKNNNEVCAMVDYGIHGDSHGHPDKLNIVLFANGKEFLLDPGRISYSVPEYNTWCRTTVAHNTVVIDEKDQQPATGKLLFFDDKHDYSACLVSVDSAYPGYILKRFLVLTEKFLVDAFVVSGKEKAKIDWIIHCRGNIAESSQNIAVDYLGNKNGYQHLKNVKKLLSVSEPVIYEINQQDKKIKIYFLNNSDSSIFTGSGIGYHLKDEVPFLMRRKISESAVFITVYEFMCDSDIQSINILPVFEKNKKLQETEAIALKISFSEKTIELGFDFREKTSKLETSGKTFERFFFNIKQ